MAPPPAQEGQEKSMLVKDELVSIGVGVEEQVVAFPVNGLEAL